jgi:hypothetical protein
MIYLRYCISLAVRSLTVADAGAVFRVHDTGFWILSDWADVELIITGASAFALLFNTSSERGSGRTVVVAFSSHAYSVLSLCH